MADPCCEIGAFFGVPCPNHRIELRAPRLSIPGNVCVHCEAVMTQKLRCPGCGWVDPMTKQPDYTKPEHDRREMDGGICERRGEWVKYDDRVQALMTKREYSMPKEKVLAALSAGMV